jgi:hypothetical protein
MKKIILTLVIIAGITYSCDDRLEELNRPVKAAVDVPGEMLFTNGLREMFDMMVNTNVNENTFRLYAQYWAQATYPEESQYSMVPRKIPDQIFANAYRRALQDLTTAERIIAEQAATAVSPISDQLNNQLAIIDLCQAFTCSVLVDIFGDIPYTEALDPDNLIPRYDDEAAIYDDLMSRIQTSVAEMDEAYGSFSPNQDPVYGGDVASWQMFGNSLLLRMGMRIADVDMSGAQAAVTAALSGGVFTSNADNAVINYSDTPPSTNPLWEDLVQSGRQDFLAANTIIDVMNDLNDPRISTYFDDNLGGSTYTGALYGFANNFSNFTQIGGRMHAPDFGGTILSYAETEFLKAEAAARGFSGTGLGTAESHYNEAVTASIMEWGGSAADAAAYLAQADVAYTTAAGGGGDASFREIIGVQKWLAMYNRGFEGWTTYRLMDFTGDWIDGDIIMNAADGLTVGDIPSRMLYPIDEATRNGNSPSGSASDTKDGKIFWDVN